MQGQKWAKCNTGPHLTLVHSHPTCSGTAQGMPWASVHPSRQALLPIGYFRYLLMSLSHPRNCGSTVGFPNTLHPCKQTDNNYLGSGFSCMVIGQTHLSTCAPGAVLCEKQQAGTLVELHIIYLRQSVLIYQVPGKKCYPSLNVISSISFLNPRKFLHRWKDNKILHWSK